MIIYDFKCQFGHQFEGWFPSEEDYKRQKGERLISCSVCGSYEIEKVPSGVYLSKFGKTGQVPAKRDSSSDIAVNLDPVTLTKAVTHYVRTHFKDVGGEFTEKAVKMHNGELPSEGIYGTANEKDRDRLDEEGVSYSFIPKLPEEFEN